MNNTSSITMTRLENFLMTYLANVLLTVPSDYQDDLQLIDNVVETMRKVSQAGSVSNVKFDEDDMIITARTANDKTWTFRFLATISTKDSGDFDEILAEIHSAVEEYIETHPGRPYYLLIVL